MLFNKLMSKNQILNNDSPKTKERKYLFLNATDIERCTYEIKREFSYNDYHNVYYQNGYETIESIFDENDIPKKYQQIVLEFDKDLVGYFTQNRAVEELFTKKEFFLKTISYSEKDGGYISGITKYTQLPEFMSFHTNSDFYNYDKVLAFICELNSHNLMDKYVHSLLSFFRKIAEEKKNEVVLTKHK